MEAFLKSQGEMLWGRLHRGRKRMPLNNLERWYSNRTSEHQKPRELQLYLHCHIPPFARIKGKDTLANPIVELGGFIKVKERWIQSRPPSRDEDLSGLASEARDVYAGGYWEAIIPRDGSTHTQAPLYRPLISNLRAQALCQSSPPELRMHKLQREMELGPSSLFFCLPKV